MSRRPDPVSVGDDPGDLYDQAPFGDVTTSSDWTILQANQTLLDLLGRSPEEVVGQPFMGFLPTSDRIFHETHYAPLLQLQGRIREVEVHLVHREGERIPVLLNSAAVRDDSGGIRLVRTAVVDVRDRHRYEEELRLARRRAEDGEGRESLLRRTLASLVAAESTDQVARVLTGLLTELLGATGGRLLLLRHDDQGLSTFTSPDDPVSIGLAADDPVGLAVENGRVCRLEESDLLVVPLVAGGRPVGVFTARLGQHHGSEDEHIDLIASLAQPAAAVIERINLDAHKDWVLSMVAHDLRSPLATISGFAQSLQHRLHDRLEPTDRTLLDRIVATSERSARLTDDLLAAAAPGNDRLLLRPERQAPGELVAAVVAAQRPAAEAKSVPLRCRDRTMDATADVDADRFQQIVDNLLSNAVKYSPPGAEVRVEASVTDDRVLVTVADQGSGIPAEDVAHLFDAYRRSTSLPTAGESSTGLGLAIANRLVRAHGGDIMLESTSSDGSTFCFWVPRASP